MQSSKKKAVRKDKGRKLFAYLDVDGFVHFNIVDAHGVWDKLNKEWMVRAPDFDAIALCSHQKRSK